MKLKSLDIAAIVVSLAVVAAFSIGAYGGGDAGQVVVEASGTRYRFPVSTDRVERFAGPRGDTVVAISGGTVRVVDSPCPDKICVAAGPISRKGQFIACLPNRVSISLEGHDEPTADGTAF
ncbi:MAG: NusG domain II-containing protein [Spirochaetes bacterium]|nr:NusG domain II-containing protein [Spirochaetota bacterium]